MKNIDLFLFTEKSKQILAYEIEKNDLRKELYLLKNKAYNLRNFLTFVAILKILNPQCIAIVVRTPPGRRRSRGPKKGSRDEAVEIPPARKPRYFD